jgi:Tol biopolymer transport system component
MKRGIIGLGLSAMFWITAMTLAQTAGQHLETGLLLFSSMGDGDNDIYLLDVGRQISVNVTRNRADDHWPAWSPDGQRIAFVSNREGGLYHVYVMEWSGIARRVGEVTTKGALSWSPDGQSLLLTDYADYGLEIVQIETGEGSDLFEPTASEIEPHWSPDGQRIAFVSLRDRNAEVYVVDANGGEARNLSQNLGTDDRPAWSPDGRWLAFQSERTGFPQTYLVDPSSGALTALTPDSGLDEDFAWSPDGTKIAIARSARFAGLNQLVVVEIATNRRETVFTSPGRLRTPTWSPDGRTLAFVAGIDSGMDVFTFDLTSGQMTRLTHNRTAELRLSWGP